MVGYIPRRFTCPQAVIHPSSNRAQCRLTTLIPDRSKRANHYTTPPPFKLIDITVLFQFATSPNYIVTICLNLIVWSCKFSMWTRGRIQDLDLGAVLEARADTMGVGVWGKGIPFTLRDGLGGALILFKFRVSNCIFWCTLGATVNSAGQRVTSSVLVGMAPLPLPLNPPMCGHVYFWA